MTRRLALTGSATALALTAGVLAGAPAQARSLTPTSRVSVSPKTITLGQTPTVTVNASANGATNWGFNVRGLWSNPGTLTTSSNVYCSAAIGMLVCMVNGGSKASLSFTTTPTATGTYPVYSDATNTDTGAFSTGSATLTVR